MDETASRIAPAGFGRHAADRPTAAAVNPVPTRPTAAQRFHLLSRFAFGATPTELNWLSHYSAAAWWDNQVALGRQHAIYAAHRRVASAGPLLTKSPAQVRAAMKATGNEYAWDMMDQLTVVTLGLQAFSPAQLYETVVDFFANHLNVANHADDQTWVRHTMDRDVVRKFAFGTFSDMLVASARNPAMLRYLNLAESSKRLVNENYGRELLELHTVGLGAHYTETDVKNSAKLLTGRTVDGNGSYVYHPADHWTGAVKILGFSAANRNPGDGVAAGDAYLRYLASHPATAAHLAQKLCVRYVSDAPSAGLVASVAKAYLANHTAILPTIKAIFTSAEFWGSQRQKVRRPAENLIATLRILGVTLGPKTRSSLDMLRWMTMDMGNVPLDWARRTVIRTWLRPGVRPATC